MSYYNRMSVCLYTIKQKATKFRTHSHKSDSYRPIVTLYGFMFFKHQAASGQAFEELRFTPNTPMPYPAVQSPSPPYPRQPSTTTSSSSSNKKRSTRMNSRKNQRPIPDGLNVPPTYDNAQLPLQFASMVAGGSPNVSPFSTELDPTVSAAAKVLFSPQGNFVQELILEEAVNIADALSRSIVTTAISSLTKNPITVGSVILRNALVGGTAAILPPMLKPVSTTLRKMKPFFPFSLAVQELEGVFHLRDEDIESLRILKRLVQLLAGVDPSLPQANKHHIMDPTGQQSFVGTTMDGKVATSSSGLIDADDLALVQQVLLILLLN